MESLSQILISAQGGDQEVMKQATEILKQRQRSDTGQFLVELSQILLDNSQSPLARQLGGILIKNTITNQNNEDYLQNFWPSVADEYKAQIRQNTLGSLGSGDIQIIRVASQAVAAVARYDLPANHWPEILGILVQNATNDNQLFRMASLMTLGYICELVESQAVNKQQSDAILTAIASNLTEQIADVEVLTCALTALKNSLPICGSNFQNDVEREYLVNLILRLCGSQQSSLKVLGLQTLCDVASRYYDFIGDNLQQIGLVTFGIISEHDFQAIILAIEFWNLIADIEADRIELRSSLKPMRGYINTVSNTLIELLLAQISNIDQDPDVWSIHKACGSCIASIASVLVDGIVDKVSGYITNNITSGNIPFKISALLVLGSIHEGPTEAKMTTFISSLLPTMVALLRDENLIVRQTAAWTLSRTCEFFYKIISHPNNFNAVLPVLLEKLQDDSKVACHACWGIINLVETGQEIQLIKPEVFQTLINGLVKLAYRQDASSSDFNLTVAGLSAVGTLIEKSPRSCVGLISNFIEDFITQFEKSLSGIDQNEQNLLCSILSNVFNRIPSENLSDNQVLKTIQCIKQLFVLRQTVVEEGITTIGSLSTCIEMRFAPYLPEIKEYLDYALRDNKASACCRAATMCIGDLARSLGENIADLLPTIIPLMISNMQEASISAEIKIQTIESFGDLAGMTRSHFIQYLDQIILIIENAADNSLQVVKESDDPDLFEYLQSLREAVLDFYTGLIQGLNEIGQAQLMMQKVDKIAKYALIVSQDPYFPTGDTHGSVIGLIGDIINGFGENSKQFIDIPSIQQYLVRFQSSTNHKLRETANWVINLIRQIN